MRAPHHSHDCNKRPLSILIYGVITNVFYERKRKIPNKVATKELSNRKIVVDFLKK